METQQPIRLRPHHVNHVEWYIYRLSEPEDLDYKPFEDELVAGYGPRPLKKDKELAKILLQNPQAKIKITEGQDELCDICPYKSRCLAGDFVNISKEVKRRGGPKYDAKEGENPPLETDAKHLKRYNKKQPLYYGSVVPAESIMWALHRLDEKQRKKALENLSS